MWSVQPNTKTTKMVHSLDFCGSRFKKRQPIKQSSKFKHRAIKSGKEKQEITHTIGLLEHPMSYETAKYKRLKPN